MLNQIGHQWHGRLDTICEQNSYTNLRHYSYSICSSEINMRWQTSQSSTRRINKHLSCCRKAWEKKHTMTLLNYGLRHSMFTQRSITRKDNTTQNSQHNTMITTQSSQRNTSECLLLYLHAVCFCYASVVHWCKNKQHLLWTALIYHSEFCDSHDNIRLHLKTPWSGTRVVPFRMIFKTYRLPIEQNRMNLAHVSFWKLGCTFYQLNKVRHVMAWNRMILKTDRFCNCRHAVWKI